MVIMYIKNSIGRSKSFSFLESSLLIYLLLYTEGICDFIIRATAQLHE